MILIRSFNSAAVARALTAIVVALILVAGTASAQIPDEFTNLKMFPKDIGKRDLINVMRGWAGALGQRCNFCHVGGTEGSLEGVDFSSDESENKRVARTMMTMVGEINKKLLPATGRDHTKQVSCVTCHRGLKEPESLTDVLEAAIENGSVADATTRYRELREEYYGSGSYDFSPATLNGIAETLARKGGGFEGSIELVNLNLEMNPDDADTHLMLAQLLAQSGDKAKAIEAVEKSLKLDPDNDHAKSMLKRLKE